MKALFDAIIEPRLGQGVWKALRQDAVKMVETDKAAPVPIVYEWTQDAEQPWSAERRDCVLVIRGPMLDIPATAMRFWNRKAEEIAEAGVGLAFSAKPPSTPS